MLLKIIGIGVVTVVVNLILRGYKSEFASLVNICGGLIIFLMLIDGISDVINNFIYLQNATNINIDIVSPIIKVIGVGYITEFTADFAEDSGNKSIADKVVVGGKIAICLLAMPIIKTLISAIVSLI